MKLINDTLQSNGKWSQKRIMVFCSFFSAFFYAFMPVVKPEFDVKEFVFVGFLGVGGFTIYRLQKKNDNNTDTE